MMRCTCAPNSDGWESESALSRFLWEVTAMEEPHSSLDSNSQRSYNQIEPCPSRRRG